MITEALLAPAKINWSLKIGKLQSNGLHELRTEIQKISLSDRIIVTYDPDRITSNIRLNVEADLRCAAPADESNLVIRAIRAFFGKAPHPEIEILLQKAIPSEAGLGGGSSDAATMLRFLARQFSRPLEDVKKIAATLGSELSFFMDDTYSATVTGTGEIVTPNSAAALPIVLCLPSGAKVSTAWAFKQWGASDEAAKQETSLNDFEQLVFRRYPALASICETFWQAGATYAGLSGSGATVFAAFANEVPADLIDRLEREDLWVWSGQTLAQNDAPPLTDSA